MANRAQQELKPFLMRFGFYSQAGLQHPHHSHGGPIRIQIWKHPGPQRPIFQVNFYAMYITLLLIMQFHIVLPFKLIYSGLFKHVKSVTRS